GRGRNGMSCINQLGPLVGDVTKAPEDRRARKLQIPTFKFHGNSKPKDAEQSGFGLRLSSCALAASAKMPASAKGAKTQMCDSASHNPPRDLGGYAAF